MVAIAANKLLAQAEDSEALKKELADKIRPKIDIYRVAAQATWTTSSTRATPPLLAHYLRITEANASNALPKREISPV